MNWLYLSLDFFTLLGPLALSFDRRVAFFKNWRALFISTFIMILVFIPWDIAFTVYGIWDFNPEYLCGINLFNLPIEEWLFFIVVPYACIFIYECLNFYVKRDLLDKTARPFLFFLAVVLIVVGIFNIDNSYTSITFIATACFLILTLVMKPKWLSRFVLSFFVSLIPFLLVNGILTGTGIDDQVIGYNSDHILNIRIGTIPIEDSVYNLLMLLTVIFFYEKLKDHKNLNKVID